MLLHGLKATVRFEMRRSLTVGRLAAFVVLCLFPPAITAIVAFAPAAPPPHVAIGVTVLVVCLLGNLLWATPSVASELEGKTWSYISSRPGGRVSMLMGKYVNAVVWSTAVCLIATTLCVTIVALSPAYWGLDFLHIWGVFVWITILACAGYAAVFTLIGTVFHRRAMMLAMAYSLVFELVIGFIPANISNLTIRSHLFHIATWNFAPPELLEDPGFQAVIGNEPHFVVRSLAVVVIALVVLAGSVGVIRFREYLTTEEA